MANASTDQELAETYNQLCAELKVKAENPARVIFARDTRASGLRLVASLLEALKATGTEYTDHKILTTPQLHYLTRCINTKGTQYEYGEPTEKGYYQKTAEAFKKAMQGRKANGAVTVDCANGVGGPKLAELRKYLPKAAEGGVDINIVNDDVLKPERLNYQVRHSVGLPVVVCTGHTDNITVRCRLCEDEPTSPTLIASGSASPMCVTGRRRRPTRLLLCRLRRHIPTPRRRPNSHPRRIIHR